MLIRNAEIRDVPSIVSVHIAAFPRFFLTLLGAPFLTELYSSYITRELGILRVLCDEEGSVLGFAAGCVKPDVFYSKLKKDRGIFFILKIMPGLLSNPVLVVKKIWYSLFYKGDSPRGIEDAGLLSSIAVHPIHSGKALGKILLEDFEGQVQSSGPGFIFLTTDKIDNWNVVQFYKKSGYVVESEFLQSGGRIMLRFIKDLRSV